MLTESQAWKVVAHRIRVPDGMNKYGEPYWYVLEGNRSWNMGGMNRWKAYGICCLIRMMFDLEMISADMGCHMVDKCEELSNEGFDGYAFPLTVEGLIQRAEFCERMAEETKGK